MRDPLLNRPPDDRQSHPAPIAILPPGQRSGEGLESVLQHVLKDAVRKAQEPRGVSASGDSASARDDY